MSMIQIRNLTFAHEGDLNTLFDHVSFLLDTSWRLGFIGRNGRGKTTFLKLLMGTYPYQGSIRADGCRFAYFPYEIKNGGGTSLRAVRSVAPDLEDWQLARELGLMGISPAMLDQPYQTLSNGERTKLLLAVMFANEERFPLIDEPTNHLDMAGRDRVAKYLKGKEGYIVASHDRAFLDGCVDHILSINRADIQVQRGNFSTWWQEKQRQDLLELQKNQQLKKDMERLSAAADRTAQWSKQGEKSKYGTRNSGLRVDRGYVGHKAEKLMQRAKSIENRRTAAAEEKAKLLHNLDTADPLKLHPLPYRGKSMLLFRDVGIRYGQRVIFEGISFSVGPGDRVALCGKNGSGKTSLLKLALGEQVPHTGQVERDGKLAISYVPQDAGNLRGRLRDFALERGLDMTLFLTVLRKLGFERAQFEKDMGEFSAGQRKKTLLAASLSQSAHLYIWDEPMNYIDVLSRMQLEALIIEHAPTMLFVEHDAAFIQQVATTMVNLGG